MGWTPACIKLALGELRNSEVDLEPARVARGARYTEPGCWTPGTCFMVVKHSDFPWKKQWFSMWKPKILWVEDGLSYVKLCCRSCLKSRTWYETENILMYWLLANQLSVQLGKHGLLKKRGTQNDGLELHFPIKTAIWVAPFSHTQISAC